MSQDEIEQFLKAHRPNFYSTLQLAKFLSLSRGSITTNAQQLLRWGQIEVRVRKGNRFFYGYPQNLNTQDDKVVKHGR